MANKTLFQTSVGQTSTLTINEAGGVAYKYESRHALAQMAATGCLSRTYYATAENQLNNVLATALKVDDEFIAKTAIYSRTKGYMKDMPALLLAILTARGSAVMPRIFEQVIDSPKMLRTYVQIMRSGVTGRKSFGSVARAMIRNLLNKWSDEKSLHRFHRQFSVFGRYY